MSITGVHAQVRLNGLLHADDRYALKVSSSVIKAIGLMVQMIHVQNIVLLGSKEFH